MTPSERARQNALASLRAAGSTVFSKTVRGYTVFVVLPGLEHEIAPAELASLCAELRQELTNVCDVLARFDGS